MERLIKIAFVFGCVWLASCGPIDNSITGSLGLPDVCKAPFEFYTLSGAASPQAVFSVDGYTDAEFSCSIDGGPVSSCTSPWDISSVLNFGDSADVLVTRSECRADSTQKSVERLLPASIIPYREWASTNASYHDGKLAIAAYAASPAVRSPGIVKVNSTGSYDSSFYSAENGAVGGQLAAIEQTDGKILLATDTYRDSPTGGLIRLNADGSVDASFSLDGVGFDADIYSLAVQSDGKILVAGDFTTYNVTTSNRLVRLNSDGSLDTGFIVGTGADKLVRKVKLDNLGRIYIVGDFEDYDGWGAQAQGIARINGDGSFDMFFDPPIMADLDSGCGTATGAVSYKDLTFQTDNKIIVVGAFSLFESAPSVWDVYGGIIRLNTDGSPDTSLAADPGIGPPLGTDCSRDIRAVALDNDGKILVGGNFRNTHGSTDSSSYHVVRLINDGISDGALDLTFNRIDLGNGHISNVQVKSDDRIIIGGDITTSTPFRYNLIELDSTGNLSANFSSGMENIWGPSIEPKALVPLLDGSFLVTGDFNFLPIGISDRLIRVSDQYGTPLSAYDTLKPASLDYYDDAGTLSFFDSKGRLWASDTANDYLQRYKSDGTVDLSFAGFNAPDWTVHEVIELSQDRYLLAGDFWDYNGVTQPALALVDDSGNLIPAFAPNVGFGSQSTGEVSVNSAETYVYARTGTVEIKRFLMSDGSEDVGFDGGNILQSGGGPNLGAIELSTGKVLLYGRMNQKNGTLAHKIAQLNFDGTIDLSVDTSSGFNDGQNIVGFPNECMELSDGKILCGGNFSSYRGVTCNGIIRLNPDLTQDTSFSCETSAASKDVEIDTIQILPDGKILAAGWFYGYSGYPEYNHVVILNSDGTVNTDYLHRK